MFPVDPLNPPVCITYAVKHLGGTIPRQADLLVGFFAEEPTNFKLFIGGVPVCTHDLKKRQFTYAYEGRCAIPLISLRFHEVITVPTIPGVPFYCVYALLQPDERRTIAHNRIVCALNDNSQTYYSSGMHYRSTEPLDASTSIEFPDMFPKIDYAGMSLERTCILREDLAKKTWHPSRFREWCLEYDDEFCINDLLKPCLHTKLWLNDVLMMENFIPEELLSIVTFSDVAPGTPRLHEIHGVLDKIQMELRHRLLSLSVVGNFVTYGCYR